MHGQPAGAYRSFGDLLRHYREVAGLSQEALAERAGLSPRGLLYLERGIHRPHPGTLRLLADALSLTPQEREALTLAARPMNSSQPASPPSGAPPPSASEPTAFPLVPMPIVATGLLPVSAQARFVGRTRELVLLEQHVAGAGPPVLLLAGEPGIGKTRLLQEIARRAVAYGMTVLTGGCQRRGNQEPYAPLLGALEQCIRARMALRLRADLEGCAWLVRLLPELAEGSILPLPPATLAVEQERRLMFGAVGRFLDNVAGPRGVLLLLDDLQWAGPDALDLLATLAGSAATVPLRVIGAYRDTEADHTHPLQVLLADLAHRGLATFQRLEPLMPEEAAHLLDDLLRDEAMGNGVRERVLQRACGIPFFL